MDAPRFLQFLLTLLVTVGLVIAPLASPVAAGSRASDTGMQMSDMAGDMPCCPDKEKQSGCQDCPLLAICMLKVLHGGRSGDGLPIREARRRVLRPLDELVITGLTRPPPDRPPRTIV
jgi:hypothetical protein